MTRTSRKIPLDKNIKKFKNIVFVDTETTGLDPMKDRVIEIGVVKIDKDNNITKYSKLINPGFKISKEIRLITGIKIKELNTAPYFEEVVEELRDLFKADLFIAHNSKFDYDFLSEEFYKCGIEFFIPQVDTIKLAKKFYPNYLTYTLDSIIARLKLTFEKRHRGLDDALVLWQLYNKIICDFGEEALNKALEKLIVIPKKRKIEDKTQVGLF